MKDYRNKRIRANVTLALGYDLQDIQNYLHKIKTREQSFQIITLDSDYQDADCSELKEAMLEGNNIFLIAPFYYGYDRKRFIVDMHQFCRTNLLRCSFTCMYFDKKWRDCLYNADEEQKQQLLALEDCLELPESYEGWNDIMINHDNEVIRQIVCHYNVIF